MRTPFPPGYLSWGKLDHRMYDTIRICIICGREYTPTTRNQKQCNTGDCRRKLKVKYAIRWGQKLKRARRAKVNANLRNM